MSGLSRLMNVFRARRLGRALDTEIDTHLRERVDDLAAAGMSRREAEAEARRRFGNRTGQKEAAHDADTLTWLESVVNDVRYALRTLRNAPAFTFVAVLSLALGIGANTAIFSLTNAIALKSLPVDHPEQLLALDLGGTDNKDFTNPLWEAIRDRTAGSIAMLAYSTTEYNLARGGAIDAAQGEVVSGQYFSVLGVRPIAGRLISPADDVRGCASTAAVSAAFAARRLGGVDAAVGKNVTLDGHPFTVIGVTDPRFSGVVVGRHAEIYTPLCAEPIRDGDPGMLDERASWFLDIMARAPAGVPLQAINARLAELAPSVYQATIPGEFSAGGKRNYLKNTLRATPTAGGMSNLRDQYSPALFALMAIVGAVLLIACANIANLLMARAASRQREMAIRLAIGAGRGRLIRQLLTESLILASAGALLGGLFAVWAGRVLVAFLSTGQTPVHVDLPIDGHVLAFTIIVATATGLAFGLAPAWRAARVDPQAAMQSGGRVRGEGRRLLGRALVTGQVALSLALVASAGLLVGSFRRLLVLDPGFQRAGVVLASADFGNAGLKGAAVVHVPIELLQRIREVPGMNDASASWTTPISRGGWNNFIMIPGHSPTSRRDSLVFFNSVADGYFRTLGTKLLAGRDINADDITGGRSVAVINESMARKMFAGTNPLGRSFRTPGEGDSINPPYQVVGVVEDMKYSHMDQPAPPTAYLPIGLTGPSPISTTYEIRSTLPTAEVVAEVTRLATATNPEVVLQFTTLSQQVLDSLTRPRLLAALSGFFGVLALLLAMIGLYGTMAYNVTQRRGELGVRIALGAGSARVLRLVVGEAGRIIVGGVVLGIVLAIAGTRLLASFLYGVTATDTATFAASAVALTITGLIAAGIPAWRAARTDPVKALRED
ncbi:MAG: ADOP family duplicated permease [Gemmatimonadales bacterium]